MTQKRKTKIVVTVGPASSSQERLEALMRAGANVFRLNFSHGTHESHSASLQAIRAAATATGSTVAIFQDLCGPKIRITDVEGGHLFLKDGEQVELRPSDGSKSSSASLFVETVNPVKSLRPGHTIFLSDGAVKLICESVGSNSAIAKIIKGGKVRAKNGIAFPDSNLNLPAATAKDLEDLTWGVANKVDYVALSFVNDKSDLDLLKSRMKELGRMIPIISKIERRSAMDNIDEIIDGSDAIMVARGDLGLEFPLEKLPAIQRVLIEKSNAAGKPVIVATQMLLSMVTALRPTRAEVSDVAAAVMSGTDALMLSEESAIGENPVECVNYLSAIAQEAEALFNFSEFKLRLAMNQKTEVPDAVAAAAAAAAFKTNASAIVACTETGYSARLIAKYRPQQPLYGVSRNPETLRKLAMCFGVIPIAVNGSNSHIDETQAALAEVKRRENLPTGALAVVTGGLTVQTPGATSMLQIHAL